MENRGYKGWGIKKLDNRPVKVLMNDCEDPQLVGLGEIDNALAWFEKAIDEHDGAIFDLCYGPANDPLRTHPRYHALLRKMNLEA